MARLAITGAGGFLGRHLCRALAAVGSVTGIDLPGVLPEPGCAWRESGAPDALRSVIVGSSPDVLVHAAFVNRRPTAWSEQQYLDEMISTSLAVGDACVQGGIALVLVSSSAVYGPNRERVALDEEAPLRPVTLYGLAKVLQESVLCFKTRSVGLPLVVVRPFNLIGPGQSKGMLLPDWVSQAADIIRGRRTELVIRHCRGTRDFVDVRDAASAIRTIVAVPIRGESTLNISSGGEVPLVTVLEELRRLSPVTLPVKETSPEPQRGDADRQIGSSVRLQRRSGWEPKIDWRTTLRDVLGEWLAAP